MFYMNTFALLLTAVLSAQGDLRDHGGDGLPPPPLRLADITRNDAAAGRTSRCRL